MFFFLFTLLFYFGLAKNKVKVRACESRKGIIIDKFLFLLRCGNKAKRGFEFRHSTQARPRNFGGKKEWSILTLDSLCLVCLACRWTCETHREPNTKCVKKYKESDHDSIVQLSSLFSAAALSFFNVQQKEN